jgi:glycosyl hydrolase family 15
MLATLDATLLPLEKGGLTANSLVYRYNIKEAGDGLSGEEGTFNICTFWLVEALTRAGRHDRSRLEEARLIFERRSALPTMLASTRKAPGIAATPANEGAAQVCATSAEGQFQKKRIGLGAAGVDLWPG